MNDFKKTLDRILEGNVCNHYLGSVENIESQAQAISEALGNLIMVLIEKGILTEKEVQENIANSFLWRD